MLNYTSLCLLYIHLLQCISLCFVCCKGIKNIKKQKNGESLSDTRILQKPWETKKKKGRTYVKPKNKKTKWQNLCPSVWHGVSTFVFLFFFGFEVKPKKQKMAEPMSQCLAWGQYFCFFVFLVFRGKTKKTKTWQNLCPSVWHGVSTFVFFVFLVFRGKTKKQKNGRTYVPVSGMGSVLLFFWFFEVKPKKQNGRTYVPVSGMGSVLLFFCFSR